MRHRSDASIRPLALAPDPASREAARRTALARFWLNIEATRQLLRRASHAAHRSAEVRAAVRALLGVLGSTDVRGELAHAAAAFAEGGAERPDAERWVYFAVAARATLEHAAKNGFASIVRDLENLDDALEDTREAVLLLEPEDYKEALASTPPNTRLWWGERARLDAGLREIDLERALGELTSEGGA